MAPEHLTDAAAWLREQIQAGRLSEKIDDAALVAIAGVLVGRNDERGGSTPRARSRRKEVAGGLSTAPTSRRA
jgi:hypothetical protein